MKVGINPCQVKMKVWIQLEGEETLFKVEVPEEADVDDFCKAVIDAMPRSFAGLNRTDLVVYANKQTYERCQRGEEGASKMEAGDQIGNHGAGKAQALFVTVSPKSSVDSIRTFRYDGVDVTMPHISRDKIIDIIIGAIQKGERFYVISSPAASGKTSLLLMMMARNPKIKFICLDYLLKGDAEDLLRTATGIDLRNRKCSLPFPVRTVICIDDAHRKYNETEFWTSLIKTGPDFIPKNVSFIFAATFLFATKSDTPAEFESLPKIKRNDLLLTNNEALEFLMLEMPKEWHGMSKLIDLIIKECNGLVGALKMSVAFLKRRTTECYPVQQNEDQLISRFMSDSIFDLMERCFGARPHLPPRECQVILMNMIFHPEEEIDLTAINEKSEEFEIYDSLMKAGILAEKDDFLQFSSPMACRFYMKTLFPRRGNSNPSSIRELVEKVISGMSASVLRQSVMDGDFPKEAVFQHLFMEQLAANTEPTCAICPELSRVYSPGKAVIKGEIDFYLNGSLRWGIELLIKGDKIGEHLKRFLAGGKYQPLQLNDWAVIDFRLKKQYDGIKIDQDEKRITVFFNSDYSTAECLFYNEDTAVSFSLAK